MPVVGTRSLLGLFTLALLACKPGEPGSATQANSAPPRAEPGPGAGGGAPGGEASGGAVDHDSGEGGAAAGSAGDPGGGGEASPAIDADAGPPPDLLTFAQGVIPRRIDGSGAKGRADFEEAIEAIDGSPVPYSMAREASAEVVTEFILELPAPTTFSRFAVPNVREVPSKFTTFTREVEVYGSAVSGDDGFALLASATLTTHRAKDEVTELAIQATTPVRWIKLRLAGGIAIEAPASTIQFSEIIGNGSQELAPRLDRFGGTWRARGASYDLRQEGALVSGCFDDVGALEGSVTGNILRARGVAAGTGVISLFILTVTAEGELRGVRSTNGAPFRLVTSKVAPAGAKVTCPSLAPPRLGCGSVIHGINFAFDSAAIRGDSEPVLASLYEGLAASEGPVIIEGHTSSEGKDAYNRDLSRRRAEAVVEALVRRGLPRARVSAAGRGAEAPIASNDDEAGRSLNRRVEIRCG